MGVIGIYVSVVLVAGRFLRMAVTDMHFRIMYDDVNNCDILLALVNDVKMCREVCAQLWLWVRNPGLWKYSVRCTLVRVQKCLLLTC